MTGEVAENILNQYGGVIASCPKGDIVQSVFDLPYSPGRIRYAHFVYIEALIEQELFTEDIGENLKNTYAMLDSRFVENADEINHAFKSYAKDKKSRQIIEENGGLASFMPSLQKINELHNFIADCFGNWHKSPKD